MHFLIIKALWVWSSKNFTDTFVRKVTLKLTVERSIEINQLKGNVQYMRQKESFCLYILDSFTVSLNKREVSLLGYIQRKKPIKLNYKPHKPYYKLQWHFFFVFVFQMFCKVFSVFIFSGSYFHVPVYVYNFCFFPFFEFIFATTILMMAPASCCRITSFNYGGKKLKDAGLTWRYHLSNIMPDSIFCDSMLEWINYFFFKEW